MPDCVLAAVAEVSRPEKVRSARVEEDLVEPVEKTASPSGYLAVPTILAHESGIGLLDFRKIK